MRGVDVVCKSFSLSASFAMYGTRLSILGRSVRRNGSYFTGLSSQQHLRCVVAESSSTSDTYEHRFYSTSHSSSLHFTSTTSLAFVSSTVAFTAAAQSIQQRWLSGKGSAAAKRNQRSQTPKGKGKVGASKGKKKAAKVRAAVEEETGRSKELDLILAALDAPTRVEPPVPEEEARLRHEIGRNYVIGRFRQHNAIDHDMTCKIHMKMHAIKMLPPRGSPLREAALEIDDSQVAPLWRNIAVWTPPIPGFDPSQFTDDRD